MDEKKGACYSAFDALLSTQCEVLLACDLCSREDSTSVGVGPHRTGTHLVCERSASKRPRSCFAIQLPSAHFISAVSEANVQHIIDAAITFLRWLMLLTSFFGQYFVFKIYKVSRYLSVVYF